jgi:uncharacterized protein (UPF0216 family)
MSERSKTKTRDNDEKRLTAELRVLKALASADVPLGFIELQKRAHVSSKTLAEHLNHNVPKMTEKVSGAYRITRHGKKQIKVIERELDDLKKSKQLPKETVEVYSIGSGYSCRGALTVSYSRKFLPQERATLDEAITQAIRHDVGVVAETIPKGCRNWRISIDWYSQR